MLCESIIPRYLIVAGWLLVILFSLQTDQVGASELIRSGIMLKPLPTPTNSTPQRLPREGSLVESGVVTDLAIEGAGYFVLRDPATNARYVTRFGDFRTDAAGFLVDSRRGFRVQGFSDPKLSVLGDVALDAKGLPQSIFEISNITIRSDGKVWILFRNGTEYVRGQVLLLKLEKPEMLTAFRPAVFTGIEAAGPSPTSAVPGTEGLGTIKSGSWEIVRVEPMAEIGHVDRFRQGDVLQTGRGLDLAISGGGFFLVREPKENRLYATRVGRFRLESQMNTVNGVVTPVHQLLVNEGGLRVQGLTDPKLRKSSRFE